MVLLDFYRLLILTSCSIDDSGKDGGPKEPHNPIYPTAGKGLTAVMQITVKLQKRFIVSFSDINLFTWELLSFIKATSPIAYEFTRLPDYQTTSLPYYQTTSLPDYQTARL